MKVVVVESPAKAKTINRYLGENYTVLASYGHVRDLPSKDGSVKPDQDFEMSWQMSDSGGQRMRDISEALNGADRLILATDPDREGEAISWHVCELLKQNNKTRDIPYERVVFNEITKTAITKAITSPRELDIDLIEAYLARRALDHLIGFSLSPVLWRKLPGSRSAGRVQSVALRLICERESEIEAFLTDEFWSVDTDFMTTDGGNLSARLTHLDGQKLDKLSLATKAQASAAQQRIEAANWQVSAIETKRIKRRPSPPFTTSTLQQEASRKLGFSASRTMQIAQKLYEGINLGSETTGLITYMRTDGVQISFEAIGQIREAIEQTIGTKFVPEKPRVYKSKAANAQEAHEAIRPTSIWRNPDEISKCLDFDQFRLYELIWKRTIASQMADAQLDQTAADLSATTDHLTMRANGSVIIFDGFMKIYREDRDDQEDKSADPQNRILPPLRQGQNIAVQQVHPEQHFTQPPPRYTDASLVKRMEELGIGRPSTYASIMQVIEKRGYVLKDGKRFIPEHRGRIVSTFLENFFTRYVEYDFTAALEAKLDQVSDGKMDWRALLKQFWVDFAVAIEKAMTLSVPDVMKTLDSELEKLFFTPDENGEIQRICSKCGTGHLELKLGKFGPFIGCNNYPDCRYTRQIVAAGESGDDEGQELDDDKLLGTDPVNQLPVYLKKGPYGSYVQLGGEEVKKPKRSSVPKGKLLLDVDLDYALGLLSLPRDIGLHPQTSDMIQAGLGRYGPYLKYQGKFTSLKEGDDLLSVGINRAVDLLAEAAKTAGRFLGEHPDGGEVHLKRGRFGPYFEHNKLRAHMPKTLQMDSVTLTDALEILAAKAAQPEKKSKVKKTKGKAKVKTKTTKVRTKIKSG
ncbi:MAG: DNA topoisomerase I [SAR116 cluster bacterium]|nr:DNA topoisomerase I [SAR116 cluster bacterium]RPG91914.1 MAG: type I DNA topoisomerase [Candidatus Puniceispirillum sp. TMED213]